MKKARGEQVGLIGVGLMGLALAEHLISEGHDVIGVDIDPARRERLRAIGGTCAEEPADLAGPCRRVLISLMNTALVCEVVEGEGGLLAGAKPPAYIVDTTTGDPDETIGLAGRLTERGIGYLDATVSGASAQVRGRDALVMVGGNRADFEACRDLLECISRKVVYVGPAGSGAKAKLATNLILGLNRLVLAEGMVFAERLGLDLEAFLELLRASPAYSVAVDVKGRKMLEHDYSPDARAHQHRKDLQLILEQAARAGQDLPLSRLHASLLEALMARGDGDLDNSVVIEEIRRRSIPPPAE